MATDPDDPSTWFEVGGGKGAAPAAPATKAAPGEDDPATWFPVGGEPPKKEKPQEEEPPEIAGGLTSPQASFPTWHRIGEAAREGMESVPPIPQETQDKINALGWLGRNVVGPVATGINVLSRDAAGAGAGIGAGIYEGATALGAPPELARDIPFIGGAIAAGQSVAPPVNPLQVIRQPTQAAQLAQRVEEVAGPRRYASEAPGEAAAAPGAPQPVGAQVTPPGNVGMTPKEADAYRATAEGKKLLESSQQPGVPDRNQYVEGVQPNLAEQEQTVNAARELKSLNIQSTDVSQAAKEIADANNTARQKHFEQTAGSPLDIQRATDARDAQMASDLQEVWKNKTEADAQPILDTRDQIAASPDWKRPAVRNAVKSVTDELYDANGNLETDPELLYGVRKHIDDMLSPAGQRETPLSTRVVSNLQQLRDSVTGVIEDAAPGFKQASDNFRTASQKIDEMRVLQDFEPKLYDTQGRMQLSRVQTMMRNIVDMRGAPGVNPYKSISDDTMGRLWNLRDDLRRVAGAQELAKTPGSDTGQNLVDLFKIYGRLGGHAAMHGVANYILPGWGSLAVEGLRQGWNAAAMARATSRLRQRGMQMLYPTNPLTPPGP